MCNIIIILLFKELPGGFIVLFVVAAIEKNDVFDGAVNGAGGHGFFDDCHDDPPFRIHHKIIRSFSTQPFSRGGIGIRGRGGRRT